MIAKLEDTGKLLKKAFKRWYNKDPFKESAVIAYYAIFSLPGLMVVVISLSAYFFGKEAVNEQLAAELTGTLGADAALQIQNITATASELQNSFWAACLGIATIIIGATGVFAQLQKALNEIWEVKADPTKSGIWRMIKVRLFSFGIIVSIGFILMISLLVSALLAAFGNWISNYFTQIMPVVLQIVSFVISILIVSFLFALMFKFLPDVKLKWRDVWIGGLVTAVLFEIGKFGMSLYFGHANPGKGYGAAGSVILIMLWVSYSSMIVFFGAEFTRAYTELIEDRIIPENTGKLKRKKHFQIPRSK